MCPGELGIGAEDAELVQTSGGDGVCHFLAVPGRISFVGHFHNKRKRNANSYCPTPIRQCCEGTTKHNVKTT